MVLKRAVLLILVLLLPYDGLDWMRVQVREHGVSILDLMVAGLVYLDALAGAVRGLAMPRFARRIVTLSLLASALSSVSLFYLPLERIAYDIKITLNLGELVFLVYVCSRIVRDRELLRGILVAMVLAVTVVAAATVLKSLGLELPGAVRASTVRLGPFRLGLTALSRDLQFTQVMLWAFPALLCTALPGPRWLRVPAGLVLAAGAVISLSRNLWLAMASQVILFLALRAFAGGWTKRRIVAGASLLGAVAAIALWGGQAASLLYRLRSETVTHRLAGYVHALDLALHDPRAFLFGAGKGLFVSTFEVGSVPHSLFLEILVSKGALTLSCIALIVALLVRGLCRVRREAGDPVRRAQAEALLLVVAGTMAAGLFAPITTSLVFLLVIALATAAVAMEPLEAGAKGGGA